jgi:hypothetical protein
LSVLNDIFIGRVLSLLFTAALLLKSLAEAYVVFFKVSSTLPVQIVRVLTVLQTVFLFCFVFHLICTVSYLYNDSLSIFYHNHSPCGRGYSFACIKDQILSGPILSSDMFSSKYVHFLTDSNGIVIREKLEKALLFTDSNGIFMKEKLEEALLLKGDPFSPK